MSFEAIEQVTDAARLKELALSLFRERQALESANQALQDDNQALRQERDLARAEKAALEDEAQHLLRRISELTIKLALAEGRDRQLALELELKTLQRRLGDLNQDKYGTRSERRAKAERTPVPKAKAPGHGPKPQPKLPLEEVKHTLDEADQACPSCGGELREWAGQAETYEEITVVRRSFVLQLHQKQKYRCACCEHIDTALGPKRLVPGGRYSVDFAVEVAVDKYADHLPLDRQVKRMAREGLAVSSATLWDQLHALYLLALPSYLALHDAILTEDLVCVDETTWRLMEGKGSKKWWAWAVCCATAVCYVLLPSRSAEAARRVLKDYAGIVMADGYAAYASLEKERERNGGVQRVLSLEGELVEQPTPNFLLVLCWMHARRPFFKGEKAGDSRSGEALDLIGELYAVEDRAREKAGGDPVRLLELRRELRDTESRAIIERLDQWRRDQTRVLPKTHLGQGLGFLENHWTPLLRFLDDPRIPLDNGAAERTMRGPVVGRKNHYGSRSERGTTVAAVFYSLIETCKLLGVDPRAYLAELARRALEHPGTVFLPGDFTA